MLPPLKSNADARIVAPSAILSPWATVVAAGEPAVQDAATITNPANDITNINDRILPKGAIGTLLALCLGYDDELSGITDPIVKLFGRYDDSENSRWELIPNLNGDLSATLATDTDNDVEDGTLKYTTVDPDVNMWDVGAFNELLVGVETKLEADSGSTANAIIQARLWA